LSNEESLHSQKGEARAAKGPSRERTAVTLSEEDALPFLRSGEVIAAGRIPWGSNYTFLVHIDAGPGKYLKAIYKPRDGERPLRDFPGGSLYKRERAAFIVSRALGWPNVPLVLARPGPYGVGSVQQYIESDPEITYFDLIDDRQEDLARFAVFDLLVNNADRKAGHCLLGDDGCLWSIDHGLTFHSMFKLRMVMLEFWGQPIPGPLLVDLESFGNKLDSDGGLEAQLAGLLDQVEIAVLKQRLHAIVEEKVLPVLDPNSNVPWPWV
jgi:uncharacterized repeat protein (TIGR03843 family)